MNILVLGIGNAQVDLLNFFSNRSTDTLHAVGHSSVGRGMKFVDHFKEIDIKNRRAVLDYASKYNMDLVCSVGSDLAMVTSAWVSHRLNLPSFITPEIATICNNKNLLRKQLEGLPGNIEYKMLQTPGDIGNFGYPFIMKPVDSQGQRGVFLVNDEKELFEKFPLSIGYSRNKKVIVENYIDGLEISVNAYMVEGEIRAFLVSDRMVWPEYPGGIIRKHRIPSQFVSMEGTSRIYDMVSEVIEKIDVQNGPVYFQIKLKDGEPKVIEATPRLDGCHMWRLIKYATGIDLLKTSVNHLLGNSIDELAPGSPEDTWILEFMCEEPGTTLSKDKYDLDDTIYYEWFYEEGDVVKPMNTFMEKCGYKIYRK